MVEGPGVRGPGPSAHFHARSLAYILKFPVPLVSIERIPALVPPIQPANVFRLFFLEILLPRDSHARLRPHVRDVDLLLSVIIEVSPRRAHSCSRLFYAVFSTSA